MHKAFQYMPDNVKTKYFIQLDADMILKENSILRYLKKKNYKKLKLRMNILAYSDGEKNLAQISKIINQPINKIIKELKILVKNKVLKIS